jgi:hypothetical protein
MSRMRRWLEEMVWARARGCCEYCQMPQLFDELPFEIDHVLARKHGGKTTLKNLCLACYYCNRFKGTDFTGSTPRPNIRRDCFILAARIGSGTFAGVGRDSLDVRRQERPPLLFSELTISLLFRPDSS